MMHINLAVKEREEADLSVFKDLYKAEIVVNEKEITKTYNKYVDVEKEENNTLLYGRQGVLFCEKQLLIRESA